MEEESLKALRSLCESFRILSLRRREGRLIDTALNISMMVLPRSESESVEESLIYWQGSEELHPSD